VGGSVVVDGRSIVAAVAGPVVVVDRAAVVVGASGVAIVSEPDAVPGDPASSAAEQAAHTTTRTPTIGERTIAS
jgi:hypothetical protein